MKLVFIQERLNPNGAVEQLASHFDQDVVVIGRGGASHIIVPQARISSEHVKLERREGRLLVSDLNSFAGLWVNGEKVSEAYLSSGDEILLGDERFVVKVERDLVTILHQASTKPVGSEEELVARDARALRVDSYLPRMTWLSITALVAVLAACFAAPVARSKYDGWSSGPISRVHKVIENDCARCHSNSFEKVQDKACLSCHVMTDHAKDHARFVSDHPDLGQRCGDCHMEHNGEAGLIQRDSRPCVSCHAEMKSLKKDSDLENVATFERHPEFKVALTDAVGAITRVSMNDTARLIDRTPFKLNHSVHLRTGLRGPNGPVTLECGACHEIAQDKKTMLPVKFEKHCRECHSLGFDERLPDKEVPHGNAEEVYSALLAEYARFLLNGRGEGDSREKVRTLPSDTLSRESPPVAADLGRVESEARKAEKEIFTRTGCFLCHEYKTREDSGAGARYEIVKPQIPDVWMTRASFDHSAHEAVTCDSCHEKARKSEKTTDILVPASKVCRQCHIDAEKPGFVSSDCGRCHPYHRSLEIPREKKQGISEFLHHMIR